MSIYLLSEDGDWVRIGDPQELNTFIGCYLAEAKIEDSMIVRDYLAEVIGAWAGKGMVLREELIKYLDRKIKMILHDFKANSGG